MSRYDEKAADVRGLEGMPQELHPLGGLTNDEALNIFDVGRWQGATSEEHFMKIKEIGRRVTEEKRLLARAEDYPGVLQYVRETEGFIAEPAGEELAYALEHVLDYLDRGDSETLENFADWRKARRWAKRRKKKDLLLLLEAADNRYDELKYEIEHDNLPRGDVSRLKRELKELQPALARGWGKVQS